LLSHRQRRSVDRDITALDGRATSRAAAAPTALPAAPVYARHAPERTLL